MDFGSTVWKESYLLIISRQKHTITNHGTLKPTQNHRQGKSMANTGWSSPEQTWHLNTENMSQKPTRELISSCFCSSLYDSGENQLFSLRSEHYRIQTRSARRQVSHGNLGQGRVYYLDDTLEYRGSRTGSGCGVICLCINKWTRYKASDETVIPAWEPQMLSRLSNASDVRKSPIYRLVSIADRKLHSKFGLRPPANFCPYDAGVSIQVAIVSTANLPCCGGRESRHY